MTKQSKTEKKPEKTLSRVDKAIISEVVESPELNRYQIGSKLVEQGIIKRPNQVHQRFTKNMYLTERVERIRSHHEEEVTRVITPLVLKNLKKGVKDLDLKDKLPFMQLAVKMDKTFKEPIPVMQAPLMVGALQVYMNNVFNQDQDVVDVTPDKDSDK